MEDRKIEFLEHQLGDITAVYTVIDGVVTFTIVPTDKKPKINYDKLTLKGVKYNRPDPLVQVSVFGDEVNRQYSPGQTMRNTESCFRLLFADQKKTVKAGITRIVTTVAREDGQCAEHHLVYEGKPYLESYVVYKNGSKKDISLEMLASFSLASLTPFGFDNPTKKVTLHRLRSQWSAEAILESMTAETLLMEPSWMNYGVRGERFGQRGSFPARPFIPFLAVTDEVEGVTWAANIGCPTSWQAEFYLSQNSINISGGLADFEFGHWRKSLKPGESLTTPIACLTVVSGNVDIASQLLTLKQKTYSVPKSEDTLPILYNDWCQNWGDCTRDKLIPLIDAAAKFGIEYFVIDAGWYTLKDGNLHSIKDGMYPNGIEEVMGKIKSSGMRSGVWFEYESRGYDEYTKVCPELILTRDGLPIRNLERAFIDMRSPKAVKMLQEQVIDQMKKLGVGYVKVDYNENIGIGCDGAESLGEGLRQHGLASQEFFRLMRTKLPDLVIEVCASGGMRAEPSMIALGSQMSFSDIHETEEGAIVAAAMHRVLQPSRSQIWATLRKTDDEQRIVNTISKAFLGRLCFSGDIDTLNAEQSKVVEKSIALYKQCISTIKHGMTYFLTPPIVSLQDPSGMQAVLRIADDQKTAVLVLNSFCKAHIDGFELVSDRLKGWAIADSLKEDKVGAALGDGKLSVSGMGKFSGAVLLLKAKK